jgi:hypothetical protein
MATVITPNVSPAFVLTPGANHYRLVGLEITSNSNQGGQPGNNPPSNNFSWCLVCWNPAVGLAEPDSITMDRDYVHGSPTQDVGQGVQCNASNCAVIDSYFSDIHESTQDSQAVLVYWTPGPIKIVDNHLSSTTENVMIGGAGDWNNPYVPSDIEIRQNLFFKPLAWEACGIGGTVPPGEQLADGSTCPPTPSNQWDAKNSLEFKSARRAIVTGNVMQNTWLSGQVGASVLFTPRTSQSGNIAVVDDIELASNTLTNVNSGFSTLEADNMCGAPYGYPSCTNPGESRRIWIHNNLLLLRDSQDTYQHAGIRFDGGCGPGNGSLPGMVDYIFQHNTVLMEDGSTLWASAVFSLPQLSWGCSPPNGFSSTTNVWVVDNVMTQQVDGDCGLVSLLGVQGLSYYMGNPDPMSPRFFGNVLFAPGNEYSYPPNNDVTTVPFTWVNPGSGDYQLMTPHWMDTTDGTLSGINWLALEAASRSPSRTP